MSDYGDLINQSFGSANPALPPTVGNIDEDPDKAQRAMDLSKATGVPSTAIFGDLEEFERQHKAVMASDIVANNPHLADFVQSNPMVPKIANDDYGNLDSVSQKVTQMGLLTRARQATDLSHFAFPESSDPLARFKGGGPIGDTGASLDELRNHPFRSAVMAAIATPFDVALRGLTGIFETGADVAANVGTAVGGPSLGREAGALVETEAMGLSGSHAVHGLADALAPKSDVQTSPLLSPKDAATVRRGLMYATNLREPPPGLLPDYDDYRAKQNADDVGQLKEATSEAAQSLTRERSPDLFRQFVAQHTDAEIGVGGDAVAALYGDKAPTPDDNLLGWVPGIESKLDLAKASGDDVSIPLADWLTHVSDNPEVMKALQDDIRVRPGGITANEVKLGKEVAANPAGEPIPEEVPTVRAASALEPLYSVGDRKLTLERLAQKGVSPEAQDLGYGDFHDFDIKDQNGNSVGTLNLSAQKEGKQLYVEMINGINGLGPRDFGPALMRDLLRQLKAEFPEAESITGHRVSGARDKAGSYMSPSASPVVKLDALDAQGAQDGFRNILEGGKWETYSPNTQAYIKPDAARPELQRQLVDTVNAELDRIVPKKVAIQGADTIKVAGAGFEGQRIGEPIRAGGTYIRYKETYPIILYALDSENALGAARHEAIHHLRNYGFFDKDEWSTLENEALAGGWLRKYNIDRRYPTGSSSLKLEEAVAEAYQDWARGQDALRDRAAETAQVPSPLDAIFQRMKDFFDGIKQRISALLGKDATWEDIFQKVSTGEVGGREGTEPLDARAFNEKLTTDHAPPDTPEFRNWFGQSKVVDESGKPKIVYHGTTSQFNAFDASKGGQATGAKSAKKGFFFTSNPDVASSYATGHNPYETNSFLRFVDKLTGGAYQKANEAMLGRFNKSAISSGENIVPAYLSLKDPMEVKFHGQDYREQSFAKLIDDAKAAGHDGVVFRDTVDPGFKGGESPSDVYVAFEPTQIKSATGNRGTFDVGNPDVRLNVPDEPSRVFERASALGMTVDQFKRYDDLMQKRHQEDIAAATKRAQDEQARQQTKQWKEDRKALRQEVSESIRQRPDVAADLFFGNQELYGKKLESKVKLNADDLTPEQKATLPRDYYGADGVHPDDVANIFGYGSGDAMVGRLGDYNIAKQAANMSAKDFVSRVTDMETDRQMRIRHGVLEDNIMDAVKEQVVGETQINMLAEETHALGMKVGQAPLDKDTIVGAVRQEFAKTTLGAVSSDRYMAAAGRAGRQAEMALLTNDPATAFQAKQRQFFATVLAREAVQLEKQMAQFDKLAKRFNKREVASVDQEYTNFIHDILLRVGRPVRRSVQDLEGEIANGEYKSLADFVEGKQSFYLREVAVADILQDPAFRKKFEDLTVDEFNATNMSVKSLIANGRDEKKITKAGVAEDLAVVRGQMIDQLREFQEKTYDTKGGRWMGPIPPRVAKILRTYGAAHIQMENLFNRWDHDNPNGVFQQYVMRDLVDASNNESVMEKRYAEKLRSLDDKADLKKGVDNTIFKVPNSDQLMKLNRGNLRTILLNAGNESNLAKLAKGYGIHGDQVMQWLGQHAMKEDWDWAQEMGDIFKELKGEADVMYRNLSGVAPESLQVKPIDTAHGQYEGWYYPVIYHPEFEGTSRKLMGKDALEQEGFVRATTGNGYTQKRTGYAAPMALDLDMLPARMKQMIHDVAMRPSVINASKIFYDKDIRAAVGKHFGNEWRDMLVPYLVDVANSANYMPKQQRIFASASEFIRQNMVSTLVGLNPGTVLKHGPTALVQSLHEVGPINFLKAMKGLFSINERTGETNWQFAMRESEELQRRHQNYVETLGGSTTLLQPKQGYDSLRSTVQRLSASPAAMSDLLSAVPTWLAQYEKSIGDNGGIHGDAVYDANRAVRRAHGSVAVTNRSAVMRGGASAQWLSSVYGFFNHIMNRQYELLWKSGEAIGDAKDGNYREAMQRAPELTSMLFAYVLAPALIEELVTPLASSDNESWGRKAVKAVGFTLGASWIGIRDVANAILNGRDPSVGLASTALKTLSDPFRDLGKQAPFSQEHAGKIVKDGATMLGTLTGVVPSQVGRVAEFGHGVATGQERPKGPWGWLTGARYGTLKGHPATLNEWQRHHLGGR